MTSSPADPDTTRDAFLGGRLTVLQPARGGHRAGLDALMLAAAVPSGASGHLVDLGSGVGVAGLAAAVRAPGLEVTLVERDSRALDLARRTLALPDNAAVAARATVVAADVLAPEAERIAAGLVAASADWVILNPPFHRQGTMRASPEAARAAAHMIEDGDLIRWLRTAGWLLKPKGRVALIFRGDALAEILAALAGRFGGVRLHPICPREGQPAHRILATGIKGSRALPGLMPGLVLHPADGGSYRPQAEAMLGGDSGWPAGGV